MKNVILSADEELTKRAKRVARAQNKTLNEAFREWLSRYVAQSGSVPKMDSLMKRLSQVRAGSHFTRDEMNDR